ncbi:MAG: DUF4279 domain-containing protein, partial [Pyrinomonadaceae bacterium]
MHEYTVEFRIYGKDLIPEAVTEDLGLQPQQIRSAGQKRDHKTNWEESMWSYDGFPPNERSKSWASLEEGLVFVIRKLWPVKDKLEEYKRRFKVMLWCGHFQSSFDGGPTLSPSTL